MVLVKKIYLFIPSEEINKLKELSCKWDTAKKKWYIPKNISLEHFDQILKLHYDRSITIVKKIHLKSKLSTVRRQRFFVSLIF